MTTIASVPIRAVGLHRSFGEERALAGVDLDLAAGEIHALVGLNGAGKTTLMRALLGMIRPDAGRVVVRLGDGEEVPVADVPSADWRHIGHLVEAPFAYAELTVAETVRSAARLKGMTAAEAAAATEQVVTELALDHWARRRNRTLSLGNRQRVGLACALVHRPRVLVLDEPSNALDPAGVRVVRRRLLAAAGEGAAVLVSSHHLDEMARIADRITVLHRGVVVGSLPPGGADLERAFFDMVYAAEEATDAEADDDAPTTPAAAMEIR